MSAPNSATKNQGKVLISHFIPRVSRAECARPRALQRPTHATAWNTHASDTAKARSARGRAHCVASIEAVVARSKRRFARASLSPPPDVREAAHRRPARATGCPLLLPLLTVRRVVDAVAVIWTPYGSRHKPVR